MNAEDIRNYSIAKDQVEEGFPFGNNTLVFKVKGKIFLLLALNTSPVQFNVKCSPDRAIELRESYDCIKPGYHMNKKLWNTVTADGSVSDKLLQQWVDASYKLVLESLPKKLKQEISLLK